MDNEITFLEPIKAGHVFFYDTDTGEVVHFRQDIYQAAQADSEGMNLILTREEKLDAEDAWEILADEEGRYEAMPAPDPEVIEGWEAECTASDEQGRNAFFAERMHQLLLEWLESVQGEDSETPDTEPTSPPAP